MEKIRCIDCSGFRSWIVYLMPFVSSERNDKNVDSFQTKCIEHNVFGMGWPCADDSLDGAGDKEKYKSIYRAQGLKNNSGPVYSLSRYEEIRKNDYVVIRRRSNGHIYVGKVVHEVQPVRGYKDISGIKEFDALSWGCRVDQWVEVTKQKEIPDELRGRLSQKFHRNIASVNNMRLKVMIKRMYDLCTTKTSDIPKVMLNAENFSRNLDYNQLEDLVAQYIFKRHRDYVLLPSSCKISELKFEFRFVKYGDPSKVITCQVKNQAEIDLSRYSDSKEYEQIYVYSDKGYINSDAGCNNLVRIDRRDLYEELKVNARDSVYSTCQSVYWGAEAIQAKIDFAEKVGEGNLKFEENIFYDEEFGAVVCFAQDKKERALEITRVLNERMGSM